MSENTHINNAGLVLLSPFLPRLLSTLELTENGKFKNSEAQIRAMFLMQYGVFEHTEFPEFQMSLNKVLTDFKNEKTIPSSIQLTEREKETVNSMLKDVLSNWVKLRNSSTAALRESFLRREGKLTAIDKGMLLTVEGKAYDMLLDSVPWNYSIIKYSWMSEILYVKWR